MFCVLRLSEKTTYFEATGLKMSSLRLLSVLRCLGGDIRSGFGELGGGMSSALVGG